MSSDPQRFTCFTCKGDNSEPQPFCTKCDGTGFVFVVEGYGYPANQRGKDEIKQYFLERHKKQLGASTMITVELEHRELHFLITMLHLTLSKMPGWGAQSADMKALLARIEYLEGPK